MDTRDREAIEDLFARLEEVEQRSPARDPEAEAFIEDAVLRQPGAPYYMAQTIIVQNQALEAARARIDELEAGGAAGEEEEIPPRRRGRSAVPAAGRRAMAEPGGGFLAGAAQTALGVTGGVLLGSMLSGMLFGSGDAEAAAADEAAAEDPGAEDDFDAGDDLGGDFGDFDVGGDF